jgi:hypothetical protein
VSGDDADAETGEAPAAKSKLAPSTRRKKGPRKVEGE